MGECENSSNKHTWLGCCKFAGIVGTMYDTTLDEKSTSSGIAEPYARLKMKARTGGGEGTTPVTTTCPEAGK